MHQILSFFLARERLTLAMMWLFFSLSIGYGAITLLLQPTWNFWWMLLPGIISYLFRALHAKIQDDSARR